MWCPTSVSTPCREAFGKVFEPLFNGSFYVFEEHGQLQGFYKVQRHIGRAAHVAYLGTLAVAPQAKGSGLARRMMQDALDRLAASGIRRVELSVEADNPRAIAFYQRFGFVHEERSGRPTSAPARTAMSMN